MSKKETPKGPEKDVELKAFSRKTLEDQLKESERVISVLQQQEVQIQRDIQQNFGVLNYTKFLLAKYAIADAPKPDEKKPDLEVK